MKKKFEQASAIWLILGSAIILLASFWIGAVVNFATHKIFMANGSMKSMELTADNFELSGIEKNGENMYYTTDGDPQMIIDIDTRVDSIKFYADFSNHPGEIAAYYTNKDGQGFSSRKRLFFKPVDGSEGWYEAKCSFKKIHRLRIDPTMFEGNTMELGEIVINGENGLLSSMKPSYGDIFHLVIYTGILSSLLKMIQSLLKRDIE